MKQLMQDSDFQPLKLELDELYSQYGSITSFQQSSEVDAPPDSGDIRRFRFNWDDGVARCTRIQVVLSGKVRLLEPPADCKDDFLPTSRGNVHTT